MEELKRSGSGQAKFCYPCPSIVDAARAGRSSQKIVRSERFECAKSEDQATIVLAWARIEDKFGETEKAIAALKWGLAELNNQPRRESTEGSAEPEAAQGADVAVDWEPAEPDLQLLTSGIEHLQTPSQAGAAAPQTSAGTAEIPLISVPSASADEFSRM
ncbi:hypothetical protein JCM8202_002228 [Rhodotorula sphaerocarpa]